MSRLLALLAAALATVVALSVSGTAAGDTAAVTGTVACQGATCQATMMNNFPSSQDPIEGFYVRTNVAISGLTITSDQSAGADCTSFHGPGGTPECFLKRDHYWTSGTAISVQFSRAAGLGVPARRAQFGP